MRVGIIQSNYLPWRGYLDFIGDCDVFVFHDDLQYTKGDWRNRNRIKTSRGETWISVPVHHGTVSQRICDTEIDYSQPWIRRHVNLITESYRDAPFFKAYAAELFERLNVRYESISELNIALLRWLLSVFGIGTRLEMSSAFSPSGPKTERLVGLLEAIGADCYLSGPAARAYLDEGMLRAAGIRLEYKCYDYPEYPQLWGGFVGNVSVIDLLFNMGPDAKDYLKSRQPNVSVV